MNRHPFGLVDATRGEQFDLLARGRRLFAAAQLVIDGDGVGWAVARVGAAGLAVTWLGPGAVFDPHAAGDEIATRLRQRQAEMSGADEARHRRELGAVADRLHETDRVTRVLWVIHRHVLAARRSVVDVPDVEFAAAVWGPDRAGWPPNWRSTLLSLLGPLTRVHLFDGAAGDPGLGPGTALLHGVEDLRGSREDRCGPECPAAGCRHHHVAVNVGRGFLGVLEQFAGPDDGSGVRTYAFPIRGSKRGRPSLRRAGKTGRLTSVYLPAELSAAHPFPAGQRRLLRALVRELTRAAKPAPEPGEFEPVAGGVVPDAAGRRAVQCPLLDPHARYVAFGGNGVRKGMGYRLTSGGGWLAKAGYSPNDVAEFLSDLAALAGPLGLTVVGLDPMTGTWHALPALRGMAGHAPGRRALDRAHLRVYGPATYVESWNALFGWPAGTHAPAEDDPTADLVRAMTHAGLSRRAVAAGIGEDPSLFAKVLNGKRRWPPGWADRALAWIARHGGNIVVAPPQSDTTPVATSVPLTALDAAREYRASGWSVVPVRPATKRPYVRWKDFQTRLPAEDELADWLGRWPEAGLALVLGPVSDVFAIDVDGPEAHAALVARLGAEPVAPKTLSGSRRPSRYHLLFTHPAVPTKAKATPWHPKLEFRGRGGLVVLPPSVHPSGHRYEWSPGRSPTHLPLPPVPDQLRVALAGPHTSSSRPNPLSVANETVGGAFSPSTARFLAGAYANGPNWNGRLFRAACDLAGRGYPVEDAEMLLLDGAAPWNQEEREAAIRTIRSAYSRPRSASRS